MSATNVIPPSFIQLMQCIYYLHGAWRHKPFDLESKYLPFGATGFESIRFELVPREKKKKFKDSNAICESKKYILKTKRPTDQKLV